MPFLSLVKHTRSIHALLFHPTLPLLLSAGADGLMVWNTTTGELLQVIEYVPLHFSTPSESTCEEAHESAIECLCWGYGGSVLFTASKDATIKIWQTEKKYVSQRPSIRSFKYLETIQAHRSAILALAFNEPYNMLISAGRDSSINLWDVVTLSPSKIAIRVCPRPRRPFLGGRQGHLLFPPRLDGRSSGRRQLSLPQLLRLPPLLRCSRQLHPLLGPQEPHQHP